MKKMSKKERKQAMADDVAAEVAAEERANYREDIEREDGTTIHLAGADYDGSEKAKHVKSKEAQAQAIDEMDIEYKHRFYSFDFDKKGNLTVSPDNLSIIEILREMGFYRYDQPEGTSEYVRITDGKIRLIRDTQKIIDAFEDYVRNLPDRVVYKGTTMETVITGDRLLRQFYKNIMYYFSSTLPRLRPQNEDEQITILHDSKKCKFLFYNNGIVAITAKGRTFIPYQNNVSLCFDVPTFGNVEGRYIWESNILNRDYIEPNKIPSHEHYNDFMRFCGYICGIDGDSKEVSGERFKALKSIIGYLLHDNYETNLKSVLFLDVNKNNSGKPAGGTGKGIIGIALSQMMNRQDYDCKYIAVGGKGFDPTDIRRYSAGDITTQLIHIEDIAINFNFNDFYNDVTDGAPFRKMQKDTTTHRVKTMLSSNQPIDLSAPSNKRRLVVFELDNYFDSNRTPEDVFGKRFFDSDWDKYDWAQFDDFMISCCELYMKTKDTRDESGKVIGVMQPPLINYKSQLLKSKLSEDFIKWFQTEIEDSVLHMREQIFVKTDLFERFSHKYQEYANREKYARAFTKWCKFYLETMEIPSGEKRSTQDQLILYPNNPNDPAIDMIVR